VLTENTRWKDPDGSDEKLLEDSLLGAKKGLNFVIRPTVPDYNTR